MKNSDEVMELYDFDKRLHLDQKIMYEVQDKKKKPCGDPVILNISRKGSIHNAT